MSLKPTGFVDKLVSNGPKTLCFWRELYSACKANCHLGQSALALASARVCGSKSEVLGSDRGESAHSGASSSGGTTASEGAVDWEEEIGSQDDSGEL